MEWRKHTRPTQLEEVFAGHKRKALLTEPLQLTSLSDFGEYVHWQPKARQTTRAPLVEKRKIYVSRAWMVRNIFCDWKLDAVSYFLTGCNVGRKQLHKKLYLYDLADLLGFIVAAKPQLKAHIRPSVSRALQGSGPIDEKLLAFVTEGAE